MLTNGIFGTMVKLLRIAIGPSMSLILQPLQLLLVILSGYVNRHQQQVNEFYRTQVKLLLEAPGKKRLLLADDDQFAFE